MMIKTGLHSLKIIFIAFLLSYHPSILALPAMAMGYTPKYINNFKHFDYVDPSARKGGKLVLAGAGTFDSFNPYILKGVAADGLGLVFETLMESSLDEPFSVYGLLADDISLADDKLSVTFRLHSKARFTNGDPVTANDVKFSFDTLMSEQAHPQFRFRYGDVSKAVVLDKRHIRFEFKQQNPELHLIVGQIPVFSSKWLNGNTFDKLAEEIPIASGPYVIDKYSLGKTLVFKRNPDYWAKDLPIRAGSYNFDQIEYRYYKDETISLEAFKAGEFDFRFEFYSKLWAREHNGPRYDSGEILKTELKHQNNAGMQGFVFNTRREIFKDPRVRRALTLAYDFEWANSHLFYNQYIRNDSYFSNTELASSGLPEGDELALLNQFRDRLPEKIFTEVWVPPSTEGKNALRMNLREAKRLLEEAGWKVQDGVLKNQQGKVFEFEFMLRQKGFERILAPYARNLAKLGVLINYRTVDASLYQRRVRSFDFDMMVAGFPQSLSPGNEQKNMFHSIAANREGSQNLAGIKDPVIDVLVEKVVSAENRRQLIAACRALDRVLLHNDYLIPNWYINTHRIAYWDKFKMPETLPLYYDPVNWMLQSWWMKD